MKEDLIVRLGCDIKGLNQSMTQAEKAVGDFSKRAKKALLGLAGVAIPSIWLGVNFEKQMTFVGGIAEATSLQLKEMSETARLLGSTTEYTATQAAEGMQYLAMAGLSVDQVIKAIPQSLNLATAGMISLAEAADISTNIMTQMGLAVEDLTKVNDVLVKVSTKSNTNVREAAEGFIYAGTMAKQVGMSVSELAGFIGLLANRGVKGSMAGSTLRQAFIDLLNPSTEAAQILKALDINIRNADHSMRNFTDVILDLVDANLDAEQSAKLLGARGGQLASLFSASREEIVYFLNAINDSTGATDRLATSIRTTLWGSFKALVSALQEVGLALFDRYKEPLKDIIDDTVLYVRQLGVWIEANKKILEQKFTTMLGEIRDRMMTISELITKHPEIMEYGIIGWFLGGRKYALIAEGMLAYLKMYENILREIYPQDTEEALLKRLENLNDEIDLLTKRKEIGVSMTFTEGGFTPSKEAMDRFSDRNLIKLKAERDLLLDRLNVNKKLITDQEKLDEAAKEALAYDDALKYSSQELMKAKMDILGKEVTKKARIDAEAIAIVAKAQEEAYEKIRSAHEYVPDTGLLIGEADLEMEKERIEKLREWSTQHYEHQVLIHTETQEKLKKDWDEYAVHVTKTYDNMVDEYEEAAKKMASITEGISNIMSDAISSNFVELVRGSKTAVEAIADMMYQLAEYILKITLQESIAKPISGLLVKGGTALVGAAMGMFGGGGGGAGAYDTAWATSSLHSGGRVGYSASPMRQVPSSMFDFAPRLHGGLAGDEYPAILQKGETVIPKGGAPTIEINIVNQTGTPASARQTEQPRFDGRKWVMEMVLEGLEVSPLFSRAVGSAR